MTPEQQQAIEAERQEREDELILLLLLLFGVIIERMEGEPDRTAFFLRSVGEQAPGEIAESMADAHLNVRSIVAPSAGVLFARDELLRLYAPTAREAADAMVDAIAKGIVGAGGDVRAGLTLAGYSGVNTNGLELGAERNIVTASNAGLLAAAIADEITGLEHLSVLDDGTTEICQERSGLRLPVDHPYWRRGWP